MYIVIGAGIIGASIAYELARAGAAVTVIDAGRIGGGTSSASFAWVNSHNKAPRAYHELNVAGMRAHAELRNRFEQSPWWHGGGTIEWEGSADPGRYRQKWRCCNHPDMPPNGWMPHRCASWNRILIPGRLAMHRSLFSR